MLLLEPCELFCNISGMMSLGFIDEVSGDTWYLACFQIQFSGHSPYQTSKMDGKITCFEIIQDAVHLRLDRYTIL